jgi:hypothetical protein
MVSAPQPDDEAEVQMVTIEATGYSESDPPLAGARPYPESVLHGSDPSEAEGERFTVTIERHDAAVEESAAMVDLVDRRIAAREEAARLTAEEKAARQSAAVLALVNRRLAAREEAARVAAAETAARLAALYTPRQRVVPPVPMVAREVPLRTAAAPVAQPDDHPLAEHLRYADPSEHTGRIAFVFLLALVLAIGGSIAVWMVLGGGIQEFFNTVISTK